MAIKFLITYKSPNNTWIEALMTSTYHEVLIKYTWFVNGDGIIEKEIDEIATHSDEITKIRDFLTQTLEGI